MSASVFRIPLAASIAFLAAIALASRATGENLDANAKDSLQKTQQLLRDKSQREKAMQGNTSAIQNDAELDKLTGGSAQMNDAAYDISADIMAVMVEQTGGDPAKLQQLIEKAQKNPEAFLQSLPAAQRSRIQQMGKQIESSKPAGRP